jgi:hypothetical protein
VKALRSVSECLEKGSGDTQFSQGAERAVKWVNIRFGNSQFDHDEDVRNATAAARIASNLAPKPSNSSSWIASQYWNIYVFGEYRRRFSID